MRTEYKRIDIYTYEELTEEARERVKREYLEDPLRVEMLYEDIKNDLEYHFPESDLDVQFSLRSCQGDGVNVYGSFYLPEILEKVREQFTEKQYKRLMFYMNECGGRTVNIPANIHYCYDNSFITQYTEDLEYYAEDLRDYDAETVQAFDLAIRQTVADFCSRWERAGYDYLYHIDDDEMQETAECNGWEFLEDGSMYF